MLVFTLIALFVIGYTCIVLEHKLRVDKSAIALLMFGAIWSVYACCSPDGIASLVGHLGAACETLVFLIGAMTIIEIIDFHGGFATIATSRCSKSALGSIRSRFPPLHP